jgi:hypothetical protein
VVRVVVGGGTVASEAAGCVCLGVSGCHRQINRAQFCTCLADVRLRSGRQVSIRSPADLACADSPEWCAVHVCFTVLCCAVLCCAVLCCAGAAELHVLDGAAQTIFVRANYSMEVGQTQGLCVTGRFTSAQACLEHAHLRIMQPPSPRRLAGRVGLVYSPCFRMRALTPLIPSTPSRFRMRALTSLIPSTPSRYRMRAPCSCLQTSDAERIGVDQVAKILASGKATGTEQREWWP